MQVDGTEHLIERTYRESGVFQWVRETYKNSIEAGAKRIEFGIEWQAVENLGVYRRTIIDNGAAMDDDELVAFFNTFGGGGKPIGGPHENFGIGAKTSLLPWNHYGVVVISRKGGIDAMIWLHRDPATKEYGLKLFDVEDDEGNVEWVDVVEPYDATEENGVDWRSVLPDWLGDCGTAIVLLGNDPTQNTALGNPDHTAEASTHGLAQYLNRRIWELPTDLEVAVEALPVTDRTKWPRSRKEYTTKQSSARVRRVHGAKELILDPGKSKGNLKTAGTVPLDDGSEVDWFLWEGDRPERSNHAFTNGFIAALYDEELYDYATSHNTYRQFGISEKAVRERVWLIIRPQREGGKGVYANSSRTRLLLMGGVKAGEPLPMADWGYEFVSNMPEEIITAIKEERSDREGSLNDDSWRDRLADRFGSRWRISRWRRTSTGTTSGTSTSTGTRPRKRRVKREPRPTTAPTGGQGGTTGANNTGTSSRTGTEKGKSTKVGGGLPRFRPARQTEFDPGILASWQASDPLCPEGMVLLNIDHPVLFSQIEYWQNQYPDFLAEEISKEVIKVYGEVAVAKVAHSEFLRTELADSRQVKELRSDHALTMSLLGLIAEEAIIATRLGGKLGTRIKQAS